MHFFFAYALSYKKHLYMCVKWSNIFVKLLVMKGANSMKAKKLLITSLVSLALTLGACGGSAPKTDPTKVPTPTPTASVLPVARITVKAPSEGFVVGDVFNLEDYVTVKLTDNTLSTEFTATATSGFEEVVSINGHIVSVLKEGRISIDIAAGTKTAKFKSEALNALLSAFRVMTKDIGNVFGFEAIAEEEDSTLAGAGVIIHQKDYTFFPWWDEDEKTKEIFPGGFLKAESGKCYQYTTTDMEGNGLDVKPGAQSSFSNYFVNMPWFLDYSMVSAKSIEGEDGEVIEYLQAKKVAGAYPSYFDTATIEFAYCALAISLESVVDEKEGDFPGATIDPLLIFPVYNEEEEIETFDFVLTVSDEKETHVVGEFVLRLDDEFNHLTSVEEYIVSGAEPEAIKHDEIDTALAKFVEAKNFKMNMSFGWMNDKTREPVSWPQVSGERVVDPDTGKVSFEGGWHLSWDSVFMEGGEVVDFTENGRASALTYIEYYDEENEDYLETPEEVNVNSGFITDEDGNLYHAFLTEEEGKEPYYAGTDMESVGFWGSVYAPDSFAEAAASIEIKDRDEKDDGTIEFELVDSSSTALSSSFLALSTLGVSLHNALSSQFGSDYNEYVAMEITVGEEDVKVFWYFRLDGGFYYYIDATMTGINTAEMPFTFADLVLPEAGE